MIEQIINCYKSLDIGIIFGLFVFIGFPILMILVDGKYLNKNKTTTQKYREGLIKK